MMEQGTKTKMAFSIFFFFFRSFFFFFFVFRTIGDFLFFFPLVFGSCIVCVLCRGVIFASCSLCVEYLVTWDHWKIRIKSKWSLECVYITELNTETTNSDEIYVVVVFFFFILLSKFIFFVVPFFIIEHGHVRRIPYSDTLFFLSRYYTSISNEKLLDIFFLSKALMYLEHFIFCWFTLVHHTQFQFFLLCIDVKIQYEEKKSRHKCDIATQCSIDTFSKE